MGIKVESAAYNSIGGRKNNEDNFYLNGAFLKQEQMDRGGKIASVNTAPLQMYAVLDGMGGGDYGEYASFFTASSLSEYQKLSEHADHAENLRKFLTETSIKIDKMSEEHDLKSGSCGSTIAMAIIGDWWYRTAHVGDSRIYLFRNKELKRITKDQSEVQRMVDAGQITPEEAWSHPRKNIITHHLGMPLRTGVLQSIISDRMPLYPGDCFLICSDGVSDSLRDNEIQDMLDIRESAETLASRIVKQAKYAADKMNVESDNITAIVLKIRQVAGSEDAAKRVKKLALKQKLSAVLGVLCTLGAIGSVIMMLI
ncbi:MAG: serine/threonine-protein phosphatase [Clostridia bacterium]|nr:serine/threonine-protein phosphatase [Clostridia bacterium]